jgi:transglutaminase-like putative cysteine protease
MHNPFTQPLPPVVPPVLSGSPPTAASLAPTATIDCDHPAVQAFAREHATGASDRERAVALNLAVRDGIRYDPYRVELSPRGLSASVALANGYGWCVPKAALLAAVCRAAGIPARLGYADVRNHLSTERMRQTMQTDLFIWHGYAEVWLDGRWIKATPAFNLSLCERFGLRPLDWDGHGDSLYHPYDQAGQRHMEYVRERGAYDDVPLAQIVEDFRITYPGLAQAPLREADFGADVARETR